MIYFIYRNILMLLMRSSILVGGQAVIEAVMMRVPGAYATAVRKNNGEIVFYYHTFECITTKNSFYGLPIIRGMIHLYESMKIGYQTLQWSADMNDPDVSIEPNASAVALPSLLQGRPLLERGNSNAHTIV